MGVKLDDLQLSLFAIEPVTVDSPSKKNSLVQNSTMLKENIQNALLSLPNETFSTRDLCEILIEQYNAPKERFTTDQPKIYPQVCRILDTLVQNRHIESVETVDQSDKIYKKIL